MPAVAAHPGTELAPSALLIGPDWRPALDGATVAVRDPATGEVLCDVPDAGAADARAALQAAALAADGWAAAPPRVRADVLARAFAAVGERSEQLALLMTREMGKPLADARGEVRYAAEFLRWFSEEAVRIEGSCAPMPDGGGDMLVLRRPVGPCLLVTPWNFPLAMAARKVAPAIAAGCTMVLKPSELTPLCSLALAEILLEAGLPPGVLNVVVTTRPAEVVEPLLDDPALRKLSFTGSTAVGRRLLARSAGQVLRTSMELGGNAPLLVLADADLDVAVEGAMVAKMRNMGQACTAANRLYVHASLADAFTERLAARMAALRVGPGTEPGSEVGPLIDERAVAKVQRLVDAAIADGARRVVGGEPIQGPGTFYPPTVLADVPTDSAILAEEIFGPVAPICSFADEEQALELAARTEHGLAAYVFTRDLRRALSIVERLETGMVAINQGIVSNPAAPFGGVKHSGLGREGGRTGIDEYLESRYAAIARA